MIIKFNKDRKDGACEYMQKGTDGDRDEKDIRVRLVDWSCEESIDAVNKYLKETNKYDKYKDNYKHIVLSFNNDKLDEHTMRNIVKDFVKLYMHAYYDDEYTYYAEAHVPKILYKENGNKRNTHIHIFIHKYSVLLDRRLRFLTHPQRRKEINLIKHYLIKKYNLNYTFRNKAISKSSIDFYTSNSVSSAKELKKQIQAYIEANIQNFASFNDMLQKIENTFNVTIKTSKNAKTPYISVKHPSLKRNIRLKGLLFSRETFEKAKEALIKNIELKKYDDEYFLTLDEILEQLRERQKTLKKDVEENLSKAREIAQLKKQLALQHISKQQINKIMFKLKLLNEALNINLNVLKELMNVAVFNNKNSIKLVDKQKDINIDIKTEEDNFVATALGSDTQQQAKVLASIITAKIKNKEIDKNDIVVDGTAEFKLYFYKNLNELLEKQKELQQQKTLNKKQKERSVEI